MEIDAKNILHEKYGDKTITINAEQLVMAQAEALTIATKKNPMLFMIADVLADVMGNMANILFKEDK